VIIATKATLRPRAERALRPAVGDLPPAVPQKKGEARHPRQQHWTLFNIETNGHKFAKVT
jgi:hypothetical protein